LETNSTQLGPFKSSKGLSEQRVFLQLFLCVAPLTDALDSTVIPADSSPSPEQMPQPDDGGRDLLTCGQCGQAFPLAHILTFIQHKQGGCGTARARPQVHTPPSPANRTQQFGQGTQVEAGYVELRRMTDRRWKEEPGVRVEPSIFTCQVCQCVFSSAWTLLQHAQNAHSLNIYQPSSRRSAPVHKPPHGSSIAPRDLQGLNFSMCLQRLAEVKIDPPRAGLYTPGLVNRRYSSRQN
uniref:C2H2-type domain-containing protein n=1 Tax=Cyprinus carpio TaxID=7962 RepID=A0A8C1T2D5_CYPCA